MLKKITKRIKSRWSRYYLNFRAKLLMWSIYCNAVCCNLFGMSLSYFITFLIDFCLHSLNHLLKFISEIICKWVVWKVDSSIVKSLIQTVGGIQPRLNIHKTLVWCPFHVQPRLYFLVNSHRPSSALFCWNICKKQTLVIQKSKISGQKKFG